MSYGHPTASKWGRAPWGRVIFGGGNTGFALSALVRDPSVDASCSFDALVSALDQSASFGADALVRATSDASFSLDAFSGRLPTPLFRGLETHPIVLVELRLPSGTVRVANRSVALAGQSWDGRLLNVGVIMRTLTEGTDEVSIELEDTDQTGTRFRDLFRTSPPEASGVSIWVSLTDDPAQNLMHIFEGKIERIPGFNRATVSIDILRSEIVDDRLMGRPVTIGEFPDAPRESIGRIIPIVFGEVDLSEGVVINTNAVGRLFFNHFVADTFIKLRDSGDFPPSGTVRINDEQITYTDKNNTARELTGATRGANGTTVSDHPKDAEVAELGPFVVKFADHSVDKLEDILIQDANGNLGEPVPDPTTVDLVEAEATWDELPRVRTPGTETTFQRVHFRDIGPANTAGEPHLAARENPGYDTFKFSELRTSIEQLSLLTNTDELGIPGDIVRAWLAVVHDPGDVVGSTGAIKRTSAFLGGGGSTSFPSLSPNVFRLVPEDLTPIEIARHDDKTNDRLYEVDADVAPAPAQTRSDTLSPNVLDDPGIWQTGAGGNIQPAEAIIDNDLDTSGTSLFTSNIEVQNLRGGALRAHLDAPPDLSEFTITSAIIRVTVRIQPGFGNIYGPLLAYLEDSNGKIPGTELSCRTTDASGNPTGCIVVGNGSPPEEVFELDITGKIDSKLIGFPDIVWVLEPQTGVDFPVNCQNIWNCTEYQILIEAEKDPTPPPIIDDKKAISNYFEVTSYVNEDWSFFSDLSRGGIVNVFTFVPNLRILEVFWVVELQPFIQASSRVPRVYATVRGKAGTGNPADIMESIITSEAPQGMGLPVTAIAREDYNPAKQSFDVSGIRADFTVTEAIMVRELMSQLADQCDFRHTWDRGRHRIIPKIALAGTIEVDGVARTVLNGTAQATVANLVGATASLGSADPFEAFDVFRIITDADTTRGSLGFSRTAFVDARTRITAKFRRLPHTGEMSGTVEVVKPAAEASNLGRLAESRELNLIRSSETAEAVTVRDLIRRSTIRWLFEFLVPLFGLELKFGDLVGLSHRDFSFGIGEVLDLSLEEGADEEGFLSVRVRGIVWVEEEE